MTRARVSTAYVDVLDERLSQRDRVVVEEVARTRVLTGNQLERLAFASLSLPSRSVVRRRVLARLVSWRILTTLERRVGGARAGSQGLVFALDTAGQQLLRRWHAQLEENSGSRVRRPWTPGQMFVAHSLDVAELHVRLVAASRELGGFRVATFEAEPGAWVPNLGGWLKPDAYVVLATKEFRECAWVEVDRATESLPTLRRKLLAYVDFAQRGQVGPDGVVPRVVITVPDARRQAP